MKMPFKVPITKPATRTVEAVMYETDTQKEVARWAYDVPLNANTKDPSTLTQSGAEESGAPILQA